MGQTHTCLKYHMVFSTKNRLPQITPDLQKRLYEYIGGILNDESCKLLEAGGTLDHIHLLASLSAKESVSEYLRRIKSNSSKWVHETFPQHRKFKWQEGYSAFTVSRSNCDSVRHYILNQEDHHKRMTFQEEYLEFLRRHEIDYDERYIWT